MHIDEIKIQASGATTRLVGNVRWEDGDRPPLSLYFEAAGEVAQRVLPTPHAFLVACAAPALRHGERRLRVELPVCPVLREGLLTAAAWWRRWSGDRWGALAVEAPAGVRVPAPGGQRWPASFLTGGVDSLALLRGNHARLGAGHPHRIRECIFVEQAGVEDEESLNVARSALANIARDAGVDLVVIRTNARLLDPDMGLYMNFWHGSLFAAAAHAFAAAWDEVHIAASHGVHDLIPWGSHPLVEPHLGDAALRFAYDDVRLERLDKLRLIAGWEVGLANLRVCASPPADRLNCGRCEKCVRTMLGLVALGALERCPAFERPEVTATLVRSIRLRRPGSAYFHGQLVAPLEAAGRRDLARAARSNLASYRRHALLARARAALAVVDRRLLGGVLRAAWRLLRLVGGRRPGTP